MKKTSRRSLLKVAAAGGVSAALSLSRKPEAAAAQGHDHQPIYGPLANATINFGAWKTDPPTTRFPAASPGAANHHALTPHDVTIQAGGTVNFIIGGFHQVIVYDDGTQPGDINTTASPPGFPQLIDDPNKRIYWGLSPAGDPTVTPAIPPPPQDRVETVHFPERGMYLVICGVRGHFVNDKMYGFVRVLP
jgi:plastocyanin